MCAYECTAKTVDRAHVMKCDSMGNTSSRKVYVIPLCTSHNRSKSDATIHVKRIPQFLFLWFNSFLTFIMLGI